jgi:hypothetical protein
MLRVRQPGTAPIPDTTTDISLAQRFRTNFDGRVRQRGEHCATEDRVRDVAKRFIVVLEYQVSPGQARGD